MKVRHTHISLAIRSALMLAMLPLAAQAQDAPAPETKTLQAVQVTGSRIKTSEKVISRPVAIISREQIDKSGVTSVGDLLQQLTTGGKALNAKFNSSGNFGFPPDGGGIGAGSSQVDLRHLESKRVLVLVDGIRWVNESSASGGSGSADLNTIPLTIVDHIEVLEDGASAIYGSDAIAGVVNVITKKKFDGFAVHAKYGEYSAGDGETTDLSVMWGHGDDKWNAVVAASYFKQQRVSSADRDLSRYPQPGAPFSGSSGTPQGRMIFCDPNNAVPDTPGFCDPGEANWYDITLNDGVVLTPGTIYDPNDPNTFHGFSATDRFNFAPFNLVVTPQERKAIFGNFSYNFSDAVSGHIKAMYNERESVNQAAPEPIFVGIGAGSGGLADTNSISALNPYNPFGYDLITGPIGDPGVNFDFIGRRPLELGPRIFNQDVKTWYFNAGLDGSFSTTNHNFDWEANYVRSINQAEQVFTGGFNVAHLKLALGDPAACAAAGDGCVPLDLFGGQARPITPAMADYVLADQHDSSKQFLDIFSFNISGDMFDIGDRQAGFAAGVEHRVYKGKFIPDILRQQGISQDSGAAAVSAKYNVTEYYGEVRLPFTSTFTTDAALRISDYSTFGAATTGKVGFKWQPIEDFAFRGTYSTGFRAPNLGELFGLTQFGATLVDPCGPTRGPGDPPVVDTTNGVSPGTEEACVALGVPNGFEQNNTQIITFTGGNPNLSPEKSKSWTLGAVYSPSWAEDASWSNRLDFELTYYHHEINGAIKAPDIQALLNSCIDGTTATTTSPDCALFTRQASGNLNPPTDFLANIGQIETSGIDFKANWASTEWSWGQLSAALQVTHVIDYDATGSQRTVGIEVADSAIPDYQSNLQLGWKMGDFDLAWNMRYTSDVEEDCNNAVRVGQVGSPGCATRNEFHHLGATTYHDIQFGWKDIFGVENLKWAIGVNNAFDKDPPPCITCSLNGYDAGTYDIPGGRFWYTSIDWKF
jgi:iron complex outermembrane receptor protein